MKQVWIARAGAPEVLEVREAPDPQPGPGEVAIRVAFAGVNFADIMARMGQYPDAPPIPCVVGYEVSGEVAELGAGVEDRSPGLAPGQRVLALTRFNGYSDRVCVPAKQVYAVPDGLSLEAAAALPVNYGTAWMALFRLGSLQPGDLVLVSAVAGGVGQAALQLCRAHGARVIGTASASKHARLRELGVELCIDSRDGDVAAAVRAFTGGRGVDLVLESSGKFREGYRLLAPLGRMVMFGVSSFAPGERRNLLAILKGVLSMPWFHPISLLDKNRAVAGLNMGHLWDELERLRDDMQVMIEWAAEGKLAPVVDQVFPFVQAPEAQRYIQERKNFGKVLLRAR